jgi:adenylate cyclase
MTELQPARISPDELALRTGIGVERINRLVDAGAIGPNADGRFEPGDVHRVRLLVAFEEAGVPLEALVEASRAGTISLRYYDQLHPPPGPLSDHTYEEFARSRGERAALLPQVFAAFGLAEPDPTTRLTEEDEGAIGRVLDIAIDTGQPDLAIRVLRLFGESTRRSTDSALGIYGEAIERTSGDFRGLPIDHVFEGLLRAWAVFALESSRLAAWLTSRHMSRAIDEYSVSETERTLEDAGFVAPRLAAPPAVAFVDLTAFTRVTEERGDEVAAAMALRLGQVSSEVVGSRGGRLVKLLGDGVLMRYEDASTAVEATLVLLETLPSSGLPSGHAGVASGPIVVREGDVFGRTVNLAARIADVTPDGRLYVPEGVASTLSHDGLVVRSTESAVLQGIGRVALFEVSRGSG